MSPIFPKHLYIYEELVRRIKPKRRAILETVMTRLGDKHRCISALVGALDRGDWDAEILENDECPYYALEAVRVGELGVKEFATYQVFWQMHQSHWNKSSIERVPLFQADGSIHPTARAAIRHTMRLVNHKIYLLTDQQINLLFERMRRWPKCHQVIWIVPDIQGNSSLTISKAIHDQTNLNVFSRLPGCKRMIVPPYLVQTYLYLKYGVNAVEMNFVLGKSSAEDILSNGLHAKRDVALPHPGVPLPKTAHGFEAPGLDYTIHDEYHTEMGSTAPFFIRILYIRVARVAAKYFNQVHPRTREQLKNLYNECIDMELTQFRYEKRDGESLNTLFWMQLSRHQPIIQWTDGDLKTAFYRDIVEALYTPEIRDGPEEAFFECQDEWGDDENILKGILDHWRY